MSLLSKLFGKSQVVPASRPQVDDPADPLIPVPIPALGILLLNLEKQKGSPLSEQEVLEIRDKAVCIMLPLSAKYAMDEKRGYHDVNPENVWPEWKKFRAEALGDAS
jgi:hypothetical protein